MRILIILFSLLFIFSCSTKYACKDKVNLESEKCDSITEVYEKKVIGVERPSEEKSIKKEKREESDSESVGFVRGLSYGEEKPIRLPPRVIRIWISPWEDLDGDLHQPSYIYSEISPGRGRWLFGEKETIETKPTLRPIEKPSNESEKEELKRKEDQRRKENEPKVKKGKEEEPLRLPFRPIEEK